jgi:Ca2+-binding RTX toxin-like protein
VPSAWFERSVEILAIENGVRANLATGIVDYIDTGFERDRLFSIENIRTGNSTDRIIGSAAANVIESGGGYNVVHAGGGDDTIIGGTTQHSQVIDPARRIMELLDGGAGDDVIDSGGSLWTDYPFGGFALTTDRLLGGGGDDRLIGGDGFVEMTGGAGADTFEAQCDIFVVEESFSGATTDILVSGATITDFDPGQEDRIELNVVSTHLDEDDFFREAPGPTPNFIGESTDIGLDQVGYSTVRRSDGSVDTVITYRFLATGTYDFAEEREFRIVLEDYDDGLTYDLFTIL